MCKSQKHLTCVLNADTEMNALAAVQKSESPSLINNTGVAVLERAGKKQLQEEKSKVQNITRIAPARII